MFWPCVVKCPEFSYLLRFFLGLKIHLKFNFSYFVLSIV
uniref:Uncharacterized protein n=1 Tax=Setaria italica TaxID=4555 RepID=K3ZFB3_SETIT